MPVGAGVGMVGIGGAGAGMEGCSFAVVVVVVVGSRTVSTSLVVPFVVESNSAVKLGPRSSAMRDNSSVVVVAASTVTSVLGSELMTGTMGSVVVGTDATAVVSNGADVTPPATDSTRAASPGRVSILTPCPSGYGWNMLAALPCHRRHPLTRSPPRPT